MNGRWDVRFRGQLFVLGGKFATARGKREAPMLHQLVVFAGRRADQGGRSIGWVFPSWSLLRPAYVSSTTGQRERTSKTVAPVAVESMANGSSHRRRLPMRPSLAGGAPKF